MPGSEEKRAKSLEKGEKHEMSEKKRSTDEDLPSKSKQRQKRSHSEDKTDESLPEAPTCAEKPTVEMPNVHSANAWESADFHGNDAKKAKFLKLMGAGKKNHDGKFVIGEASKARVTENVVHGDKLVAGLEKEYKERMSSQLARSSRHCGLGFSGGAVSASGSDIAFTKATTTLKDVEEPKNEQRDHVHDVNTDHKMHFISEDHKHKLDL